MQDGLRRAGEVIDDSCNCAMVARENGVRRGSPRRVAPFRRELLAHCYRMTGSLADAEGRAAGGARFARGGTGATFRGPRRAWRTWLLSRGDECVPRPDRGSPRPHAAASREAPTTAIPAWLEPFPDALIEDDPEHAAPDARPTRGARRTRLAFVTALQRLPARQARGVDPARRGWRLSADEGRRCARHHDRHREQLAAGARVTSSAPMRIASRTAARPVRRRDDSTRPVSCGRVGDRRSGRS